jgi:shikimate dehydrogenase
MDGDGFVAALQKIGGEPAGMRCFMAGAGGVAAGIGFALARAGAAALTIHNRTPERAQRLAERIRRAFPQCDVCVAGPDPSGHGLVVNATSAGLHPGDPLPLDISRLSPGMIAADVVIEPRETPFLRTAAARGCRVQYGAAMVHEQLPMMLDFMGPPERHS